MIKIGRTKMKFDWPIREQWAERRRTVYADMENPRPATRRLSAYATAEEIVAAIDAAKAFRRDCLRAQRAANRALGPLGRQKGESARAYDKRIMTMTKDERDIAWESLPSWDQEKINGVLKELQNGVVPWRWISNKLPALDLIINRYEVAAKQADAAWHKEVAATPIDDAAWELELERRRQCEDDDAHPQRFIHWV
jgi:hypothetical protein